MTTTLRREFWPGYAVDLGEGFRVQRTAPAAGSRRSAGCALTNSDLKSSSALNGDLQRSEVCRSTDEVLSKTEAWKAALLERGWHDVRLPD
jgi:hypothetical protein